MPIELSLPQPFSYILANISESGRVPYLSAIIKHASVCEKEHGSAVIRLGVGGKRKTALMPCYWIMHLDGNGKRNSYEAYFYKDVPFKKEGKSPNEDGTWTDNHINLDQLLSWLLSKGPAQA